MKYCTGFCDETIFKIRKVFLTGANLCLQKNVRNYGFNEKSFLRV